LISSGTIIALDQWTKSLVVQNLPFLDSWLPEPLEHFSQYFRIVHWHNSGAAFGLFQDGNLVFMILATIASLFIIGIFPSIDSKETALRAAMILQLAGAVGNLIDRFNYGYVIDFISIGNFPVFNIADSSISIGVAVLLLDVLIQEVRSARNQPEEGEDRFSQEPS
jgi:signal peptidase II